MIRIISGTLRRGWWIILKSAIVCAALVAVLTARDDTPDFRATAVVQVRSDGGASGSVFENDLDALMAAQRQVLLSSSVLDPASRDVGGITTPVLRDSLDVDIDAGSGTMRVTVSNQDAETAIITANAVAESFVSYRTDRQGASLRSEADSLGLQLADLETRMATLSAQGPASTPALDAARSTYNALVNRQQELLTRISTQPDPAEIITASTEATKKGKDSILLAGSIGAAIGFGIGLVLAGLREFFDDRVHHRFEAERAAKVPVIAELPFDAESASSKRRSRVSLAAIDRPASPLAEAIRSLRTAVTFLSVDSPIRCLTVTSGEPDEGKSLVAANLAVAYAQAGVRTILLSGDLRRPSLDARLLPQSARGFTDLIMLGRGDTLRGGALASDLTAGMPNLVIEAHEVVYRTTIPNLSFVPAGTLPPNPAELLASKGAANAIADLRQYCEMLIIDSPPTIVTDGVILADLADAVLLIAAADQSHAARISAAVEAVSGGRVRILGLVLNKLRERAVTYQPYGASSSSVRRERHRDVPLHEVAKAQATTQATEPPAPTVPVSDVAVPEVSEPAVSKPADQPPAPAVAMPERAPEPVAEPEPELVVAMAAVPTSPRSSFPPPTSAPMTPPISLEQVRSAVPPPPLPRVGKVPPPPVRLTTSPPPSPGRSVEPPPPVPTRLTRDIAEMTTLIDEVPPASSMRPPPNRATRDEVAERRNGVVGDPTPRESVYSDAERRRRRERERELRRLEHEERDRQTRIGAELAKARRSVPRGLEALGDIGAEALSAPPTEPAVMPPRVASPNGASSGSDRRALKRRAKEVRLAAKLKAKDQRRIARQRVERSKIEAKQAITGATSVLPPGGSPVAGFPDGREPQPGPASPPR